MANKKHRVIFSFVFFFLNMGLMPFAFSQGADMGAGQMVGSLASESNVWDFKRFKLTGNMRFRADSNVRTNFTGQVTNYLIRVRPQFEWSPVDEARVVLVPQASKRFGDPLYVGSASTVNTKYESSGRTTDPSLFVHQAYGHYRLSNELDLKLGRQVLEYGEGIVIGQFDWNNVGRSFDAIKLESKLDFMKLDAFFSRIHSEDRALNVGQTDFAGLYSSLEFGDFFKEVDVYQLYFKNEIDSKDTLELLSTGVRLKSDFYGVDYRVEGTLQYKSTPALQVDGEAGYTFEHSQVKPRIGLGYFYAGSQYNQLFPSAHRWLGIADIFGRRNIQGFFARISGRFFEKLKVKVDYHMFQKAQGGTRSFDINGNPIGIKGATASTGLGSEVDVVASYHPNDAYYFEVGGGIFAPQGAIVQEFGTNVPKFYYAQTGIYF